MLKKIKTKINNKIFYLALIAFLKVGVYNVTQAQELKIAAGYLDADNLKNKIWLKRNAVVNTNKWVMTADIMDMDLKDNKKSSKKSIRLPSQIEDVRLMHAQNNVRLTLKGRVLTASAAHYDAELQEIICVGNVVMTHLGKKVSSDRMVIDLKNDITKVTNEYNQPTLNLNFIN